MSEIPTDVLAGLNAGQRETRNLVEGLAIDFRQLLTAIAPEFASDPSFFIPTVGLLQRMAHVANALRTQYGVDGFQRFADHPSDTVRGWAAYIVGRSPDLPLAAKLTSVRGLADDPHFGVREWAWLAVRPGVVEKPDEAIELLAPWAKEPSANLRRFASEITRPRGVWCNHIACLKQKPELGLPILETLRGDASKYVQDSVANWLNDAGKSKPQWLKALCRRWKRENPTPETERICKRAMRNL